MKRCPVVSKMGCAEPLAPARLTVKPKGLALLL